jgi:hypothetical protein
VSACAYLGPQPHPHVLTLAPNPTLSACLQRYASEGARVLAMAYKQLPDSMTPSELRHLPRGEAESGLRFAGKQSKHTSRPSGRGLAQMHQVLCTELSNTSGKAGSCHRFLSLINSCLLANCICLPAARPPARLGCRVCCVPQPSEG